VEFGDYLAFALDLGKPLETIIELMDEVDQNDI
jgi:hypothetical protein